MRSAAKRSSPRSVLVGQRPTRPASRVRDPKSKGGDSARRADAPKKRRTRGKKAHALVLPKFEVLADGAHAVTIPVYTKPFSNGSQGTTKIGGILRAREKAAQRAVVLPHLFGIGISFRDVTLVRLSPSKGLDTGNLWNALKAVQDEVAAHLGIDDGPESPATWGMENEKSPVYGVRVELRKERAKSKAENAGAWAALMLVRALPAKFRGLGLEEAANDVEEALRGAA